MKVKELFLQNFKCFTELSVQFDERLTVFVADNGMGKTTVLDGIAVAFGRLLTKLPKLTGISTKPSDIRVINDNKLAPFLRYWIRVADFDGKDIEWSTRRNRDGSAKTLKEIKATMRSDIKLGTRQLDQFAETLIDSDISGEDYRMPVIAYYGTSRAVFNVPMRRRNFRKTFRRFDALSEALSPDTRFKSVFEWFSSKEDEERRAQVEKRDFQYHHPELQAVRKAIESMLPGVSNPRTEIGPLRLVVDWTVNNVTQVFRIEQLSDGYKTALAMVMDIARRMAQANPPDGASSLNFPDPLETPAIILIDEIDLHLHPRWQQRIIPDLLRTFPATQFIVTTHSPQVASTVPSNSLLSIESECDAETGQIRYWVEPPPEQIKGVASSHILATTMHTDPVPPVDESKWLSEYRALIQEGLHETSDGLDLKEKLIRHFGDRHTEIMERERMIRLESFKRRLPVPTEVKPGPRG